MIDPATKAAAVRMLMSGTLTFDEVVKLACVSRFTLYRWAKELGFDPRQRRAARAQAAWDSAVKGPRPRLSKKRLREIADEAKVAWDQRHDQDEMGPSEPPAPWE